MLICVCQLEVVPIVKPSLFTMRSAWIGKCLLKIKCSIYIFLSKVSCQNGWKALGNWEFPVACIHPCATVLPFVTDVLRWKKHLFARFISTTFCIWINNLNIDVKVGCQKVHILDNQEITIVPLCVGICHRRAAMRGVCQLSVKPTFSSFSLAGLKSAWYGLWICQPLLTVLLQSISCNNCFLQYWNKHLLSNPVFHANV